MVQARNVQTQAVRKMMKKELEKNSRNPKDVDWLILLINCIQKIETTEGMKRVEGVSKIFSIGWDG